MTTKAQQEKDKAQPGKRLTVGKKLGELKKTDRSDLPEYIKADELQSIYPFTIYGGRQATGRFGPKINFQIAYQVDNEKQKKILTLAVNDERQELLADVLRNRFITNCRIIQLHLGGNQIYWKIVDASEELPDDIDVENEAEDIPV